uniref:Uncharacterized protein n=1 Tax=Globisporangium ultimum (strain ATCC 200006 / CBS 805.95 / DAOM BR144) TaxID=431595 RepID=K3WEW3_GLOUD
MLATPIPCLAVIAADAIALEPPDKGLAHSSGRWVRGLFTKIICSHSLVSFFNLHVPGLDLTVREHLLITLLASFVAAAASIGLVCAIGFPMPFSLAVSTTPWITGTFIFGWLMRGRLIRENAAIRKQVRMVLNVFIAQVMMAVVYPTFNTVFHTLTASAETKLVLVLPVVRLIYRNLLCRLLHEHDDIVPVAVIFNVELFNALFMSCSMRPLTSINMSL